MADDKGLPLLATIVVEIDPADKMLPVYQLRDGECPECGAGLTIALFEAGSRDG